MTTDEVYYERGISRRHGFLTEYYVDAPEYIVKVPDGLRHIAVIAEPLSIAEKGIGQAYEIQRRLKVWRPRKAAVLGAGSIGLLASLVLRLRGIEVTTFGKSAGPSLNSELVEAIGARYVSTDQLPLREAPSAYGPFDLIFEATGFSPIVFEAMQALGKNGVLVLASVTGGNRTVEVPSDKINLGFVLGNKVMVGTVNANREYFEAGMRDLAMAEAQYAGWVARLLTHPVGGLQNYRQLMDTLTGADGVIKAYMEIAA
jgi:threonine dehydrogenase-like Zn-dependent dehydrogenase